MLSVNPNNNRWLAQLMKDNPGMTRRWIAEQLHVQKSTVDRWLAPRTKKGKPNPTHRRMPDMAAQLLQYRLDDPDVPGWTCVSD